MPPKKIVPPVPVAPGSGKPARKTRSDASEGDRPKPYPSPPYQPRLKPPNRADFSLYAEALTPGEMIIVQRVRGESPDEEIALLRVLLRRLLLASKGVEDPDLLSKYLEAFGRNSIRLATLMKVRKSIGLGEGDLGNAILATLKEVMKEFGIGQRE